MTTATQRPRANADSAQLRRLIDLLLCDELARSRQVPVYHQPEILSRSPAKVEILVNSLLVFIEHGITEVTVQDLLDAAGISRRTFYKYFRNKIDVLESLYKLAVDVMVVRYKTRIAQASTVTQVAKVLVDVYFEYHRDLGPVIRMMQEEAMRSDSPLAPHRRAGLGIVVNIVNEELQRICGRRLDSLVIMALMSAMESASIDLLREGVPNAESLARWREVMTRMTAAVFIDALESGD